MSFGYAIVNRRAAASPHIRDDEGRNRLLACVQDAVRNHDKPTLRGAVLLLWANQHLDDLWRLEARLGERANISRSPAR